MTPEQVRLESEIAGILRDNLGVSGWTLRCAFAAQLACVTIVLLDLGAHVRFHGAHADIVNAVDVAGYKPSVAVLT